MNVRLLAALLLAAPLAWGRPAPTEPTPTPKPTGTWTQFRGGGAQRGLAAGTLTESLTPLWRHETGGPIRSSAVVDARRVYVGSDDGTVRAVDRTTGALLWQYQTGGPVAAPPLLVDGVLYVGSESRSIVSLNAVDGSVRWTRLAADKVTASATWLPNPPTVIVGAYDGTLHALAPLDGSPRWTYDTGSYLYGSPALVGDQLVLGGCDGNLHVLGTDGKLRRTIPIGAYVGASVAADGDTAWVGHFGDALLAFDPATGATRWTWAENGFPVLSSASVTDDRIVFGSRDRKVHALDRATGTPIWTFPTLGKVDSSPVVAGDKLVIGSMDGRLYLLDLAFGDLLWSFDAGQPITATPAVADGQVFVGAHDGVLYAFAPNGADR